MKHGLTNETYLKIKKIIQKYKKYEFKLFGSRARGNYKKESDIDIAVFGNVCEKDKLQILNEFDLINIPYMIDVIFIQELTKKELIQSINKECIKF